VIGEALVIVRGPDAYVSPSWYASTAEHGRVVPRAVVVPTQAHPPVAAPVAPAPLLPVRSEQFAPVGKQFVFDGGAGTYLRTAILAFLVTFFTIGICYPFALVLRERWRAKHSLINGQQLVFTGSATGLFGLWLKWMLLFIVTVGIYAFWISPRLARWKWEHTGFQNRTRSSSARQVDEGGPGTSRGGGSPTGAGRDGGAAGVGAAMAGGGGHR